MKDSRTFFERLYKENPRKVKFDEIRRMREERDIFKTPKGTKKIVEVPCNKYSKFPLNVKITRRFTKDMGHWNTDFFELEVSHG